MTRPDTIKNEITLLQQHKRSLGNLLMTQVLMLVVMVVLLFTADIRTVYATGAVVLVYTLLVIRPNKNRYTRRITELECLYGVGGSLSGCSYQRQGTLPRDALEKACLVSARKWDMDAVCRHRIQGDYLGAEVQISEASFAVRNSTRKGDVTFLSGTWIQVQLPWDSGLEVCCMSRGIPQISNMLPDLSHYDLVYTPFENKKIREASYAFTKGSDVPVWLEKHFGKLSSCGPKVMLSVRGDRLAVMIESRFYAAKHNLSDTVTEQTLSFDRLPEKAAVLELIRIIQRNAAL